MRPAASSRSTFSSLADLHAERDWLRYVARSLTDSLTIVRICRHGHPQVSANLTSRRECRPCALAASYRYRHSARCKQLALLKKSA